MGKSCLAVLLTACLVAAWPIAARHAVLAALRIVRLPPALTLSTTPRFPALRACWRTKAARELLPIVLASPLRPAAMARVRFTPPAGHEGGCVFATLRSPWLKLLSACCREQRAGRVLVRGGHSRFWRETAVAADRAGLRTMVNELRTGGFVFATMEAFVDREGCPVNFLGASRQASRLPARLAAAGGVPLVATLAVLRDGWIEFEHSPAWHPDASTRDAATAAAMAWLEARVRQEPAAWNETLRGWAGILRESEAGGEEPAVDADRLAGDEGGRG